MPSVLEGTRVIDFGQYIEAPWRPCCWETTVRTSYASTPDPEP